MKGAIKVSGDTGKSIMAFVEIQENGIIRKDNIVIGHLTDYAKDNFEKTYIEMVNKSIDLAMKQIKDQTKTIYMGATSTINTGFKRGDK